jgi:hypothetical protein
VDENSRKKLCGLNQVEYRPEASFMRIGCGGRFHVIYAFVGSIIEKVQGDILYNLW